MRKHNQHIQAFISLFLALLVICGTFSHFIYFKIQHYSIKQEIKLKLKKEIPETELISFLFSISDFDKKVDFIDENEFRHEGKMYDIVYKKYINKHVILKCISDEQETTLFTQLEKLIQKKRKETGSEEETELLEFLLLNFIIESFEQNHFTISSYTILTGYNFNSKTWIEKITSPPPQQPLI